MNGLSVVIPIHNESEILEQQVTQIISELKASLKRIPFEILLVENGSTDDSFALAQKLDNKHSCVRTFHLKKPSYGYAFKYGISKAKFSHVVQYDIDFWSTYFVRQFIKEFSEVDVVIGSKNLRHSKDTRSISRKLLSRLLERFIQYYFKVPISDTHGLKIVKIEKIKPHIAQVKCTNHFFDTELLIRCYKNGCTFQEIPVDVSEMRKTRFAPFKRFKHVLAELSILLSIKQFK